MKKLHTPLKLTQNRTVSLQSNRHFTRSLNHILSRAALIAIMGLSLGGCHVALLGGAAVAGYEVTKDERNASEVANDARIVADIKQKLLRDKTISGWDVNVDSYKGEITLHGNVVSQTAKERALLIAQSVKGVSKITSKLIIIPKNDQ
ncbi:BON domain-containing protein [Pseudomonadales bacterium]|nr:BON domain-containing protein [Pseudomonadales bacterium]